MRIAAVILLAMLHGLRIALHVLCFIVALALLAWLGIGAFIAWRSGEPEYLIAALLVFAVFGCLARGGPRWWIWYQPGGWRGHCLRARLDA